MGINKCPEITAYNALYHPDSSQHNQLAEEAACVWVSAHQALGIEMCFVGALREGLVHGLGSPFCRMK